ncbi:MAG TPA: lipid II flippase MurJ [Ktedonobacteraceae bacterium]|nr:lipid II flippase MurJ [Ktedonobacteraceae bacterium]
MAKESIENQPESTESIHAVESIPLATADASSELIVEESTEQALANERRHIAKSATLVMLGNLGSSIIGMVRQIVVVALGASIAGPFNSALLPAQTFNDFLVNGSVPGALIPTFNDYAAPEKRDELRRLVFTLVNLVILIVFIVAIIFLFISPWFVKGFLVTGYTADQKQLTLQFSQIIFFSLLALAPFAVLLAALYARKEFGWPAFATVSYHLGIILGALVSGLVGAHYLGYLGLAFGVLLGAAGEIALLIPGMHHQQLRYLLVLDLKHPALWRIVKLYIPVALSFLISMGLIFLDQHLASQTPGDPVANYTAMRAATTLIQFPIGLVAAALSFAVLPTLSEHVRAGDTERFKQTLLLGFRIGLLLMIPAAAGLIVLRGPIVELIFQHHAYTADNAALTALALQNYAYQLPFVALDQLLIAAFYARKNTIIPVAVGMVSILGYLAVALPFWSTIGMPALAFANAVQNSLHAIILLVILRIAIGHIRIREMVPTVLKILVATALMVAVAWGMLVLLGHFRLFSQQYLLGQLLTVVVAGGLAALVYVGVVLLLRVEEVAMVKGAVMAKLRRN